MKRFRFSLIFRLAACFGLALGSIIITPGCSQKVNNDPAIRNGHAPSVLPDTLENYNGLICRGVEEVGSLLIGHPGFGPHLVSLFVTGSNPMIGSHTLEQHLAWVNDPLHSYVPDGTGGLCVWAHPKKNIATRILALPGLTGMEALYGWEKSNKISRDKLWDEVLRGCYDSERPFLWGFPTDDTHLIDPENINLSWYAARVPKMNEFALKKALREGAFYVSSGPKILDIAVKEHVISLKLDQAYDVLWLRDGQYLAEEPGDEFMVTAAQGENNCLRWDRQVTEAEFDLNDFQQDSREIRFIRAIVRTSPKSVALTQPWGIGADGSLENPYPSKGIWVRGMTHNHTDAPPGDSGKMLKAYRLAYQSHGQKGAFTTDYSYRETPYQWLPDDGVPQIESVIPVHCRQGNPVKLTIKGINFDQGCVVQLNDHIVQASFHKGMLTVHLPGDLPAGKYDICISNPKGFRGTRPAGLTIRNRDANTKGWRNFTVADGLAYPHNTCVECVGNEVWVGSLWGVSRYKDGKWQVFRDEIPGGFSYDIQPDTKGGLWISGAYGMVYCSPDRKWSSEKVGDADGLRAPDALERWGSMTLDRKGSLWVSNRWRGGMAIREGKQWKRLTIRDDGLPNENPNTIEFDSSGVLWAGFTNGLSRWFEDEWEKVSLPEPFTSANHTFAITAGADGAVWISMTNSDNVPVGGVLRLNGDKATAFTPENSPLPSHLIRDILVDRTGNVWFASDFGVTRLDTDGHWHTFTALNSGLGCDIVQGLAEDHDGQIWFATAEGVSCFCKHLDRQNSH